MTTLKEELTTILNKHSTENGSDTPDFVLAMFLLACLTAFDDATNLRREWYAPLEESTGNPERPATKSGLLSNEV